MIDIKTSLTLGSLTRRSRACFRFLPPELFKILLAVAVLFSQLGATSLPTRLGKTVNVIMVTTTSDSISPDGLCSLREAVIAANSNAPFNGCSAGSGADTIDLSSNFAAPATFQFTISGVNENGALTGDLDLEETLSITGAGPGSTIIRGNSIDRVFQTLATARISLTGMTIETGNPGFGADGGGIWVEATSVLTLTNTIIQNNTATYGGGIKVSGTLSASNSTIAANQGGGIENSGGRVALTQVNVTGNSGGYGIRNLNSGVLDIHGGQLSDNLAGGMYNDSSSATLIEALVQNNTGGGLSNVGVTRAVLTVERSQIIGNTAFSGAGISNSGIGTNVRIISSKISGNVASGNGGGVSNNGIMAISASTIDQNQAASGGGINHRGGSLDLTNTTISGNIASDNGGGLYNRSDTIALNVTFYNNLAGGPGTGGNVFNDTASIGFRNTILANPTGEDNCTNSEGFIISSGYNLESANTCGFSQVSDHKNTNPLLGFLQDNGGNTFTHALLPGSPAIDAGTNAYCPATDQRNSSRPVDGDGDGSAICDIGSYEYFSIVPQSLDLSTTQSDGAAIAFPGVLVTYDIVFANLGNKTATGVVITDTLPLHTDFYSSASSPGWTQVGSSAVYRYTVPSLMVSASGHISITVRVDAQNPPVVSAISNSVTIGDDGANGADIDLSNNISVISTPTRTVNWLFIPLVLRSGN